jgi:large subunit ribosomal protein L4
VLDAAKLAEGRTRVLAEALGKLGWTRPLIIDGPALDSNMAMAASNLPQVDLLPQQGANVYDILRCGTLVLTRAAVEHLEARLK